MDRYWHQASLNCIKKTGTQWGTGFSFVFRSTSTRTLQANNAKASIDVHRLAGDTAGKIANEIHCGIANFLARVRTLHRSFAFFDLGLRTIKRVS